MTAARAPKRAHAIASYSGSPSGSWDFATSRSTRSQRAKGSRALAKKPAHFAEKACPGGIAGQEDVVAAFERDESCSGNTAGDQPAVLERYGSVVTAMHNERWNGDIRQKVENVEIPNRPE